MQLEILSGQLTEKKADDTMIRNRQRLGVDSMHITIERAVSADAAALLDFLKQVGGESDNLTFGAEGLPFSIEAEEAFLSGLETSRDGIMLVAKADGKIVGNASLSRMPRRMCHRGELGVSVLKEFWNRGIGGQMMDRLVAFARENAFDIIELQVRSDNLAAIHLYEKFGFKKLATYPGFFKIEGQYIDFDIMYMPLK